MLDQADAAPVGDEVMPANSLSASLQQARARIQVIASREAGRLWLAAAPSLARVPALPDVKLSDVLVACLGEAVEKPRAAIAGAAVDLLAGAVGLLTAAVTDTAPQPYDCEKSRNWAEVASVAAHDVLACRALRLAEQTGSDVLDVVLAWMESVIRCRQRHRGEGPRGALELYELGFELPARAAAVLSVQSPVGADAFVSVGRLLGGAYAHGDERRLQEGERSRFGLDLPETEAAGLRAACGQDLVTLDEWERQLREDWSSAVEMLRPAIDVSGMALLEALFDSGLAAGVRAATAVPAGGAGS